MTVANGVSFELMGVAMQRAIQYRVSAVVAILVLTVALLVTQSANAPTAQAVSVSGTDQSNAQAMLNSGRLGFSHAEPEAQIRAYAGGSQRVNPGTGRSCQINSVLLSALRQVVVERGFTIKISSLNRWCEQQNPPTYTSYHWVNNGGHAVDVNVVNGSGPTSNAARSYIAAMGAVMPLPTLLGEPSCWPGISIPQGWGTVPDNCSSVHIEYRGNGGAVPPPSASFSLSEIGAYSSGWQKWPTGQTVQSQVFSVVDMGRGWGDTFSSSGGRMLHTLATNGGWQTLDSGISLNATSMSAVNVGQASPHVFAVENGQIFLMYGDSSGWHKAWTGVNTTGKISAVRMGDGSVQIMINEGGTLHQMWASGGGWVKASTLRPVGDQFEAVYMGGNAPQVMTVLNGQIHQIWAGNGEWVVASTGISVGQTAGLTAVNMGDGWPQVFTSEGGTLYQTAVVNGAWTRMWANVAVNGPLDALNLGGGAPARVYTTG